MTPYRSTVAGRDGFAQLLRAEWTKLHTVRGWLLTLGAAVVLTVGISLLMALGSEGSGPGGQRDAGSFDGRPLDGDGDVVARVAAQQGPDGAKAGLMLRTGDDYAAVLVVAGAGIRMQYARSSPLDVAVALQRALTEPVRYRSVPADGADRAAERIASLIAR
jgi:hypothetical protein